MPWFSTSNLQTGRKYIFIAWRYLVCGTLLWQPWQMNTEGITPPNILCILHSFCVYFLSPWCWGLPDSSDGKESAFNAGDPGWIPGLRTSAGEGIGYRLQYSWASLVAQLVKNMPAMQETWVWSLGWEDPLEKGKASHSSVLTWRIP